MQLYALDSDRLITARHAEKQRDYSCLECGSAVRLRRGIQRQPHFYHLDAPRHCHLNGKSFAHLHTQLLLQESLPKGDCFLEYRFPEIQRIADVVWWSQKLIFEVQCSFISSEEIQARQKDYASLGFHVIWILHDARYNRRKLSAAELILEGQSVYFTNMNADGQGEIYDQLDLYVSGTRIKLIEKQIIDLKGLHRTDLKETGTLPFKIPTGLQKRLSSWPLSLYGDLINQTWFNACDELFVKQLEHAHEIETMHKDTAEERKRGRSWKGVLKHAYRVCLHAFLERVG